MSRKTCDGDLWRTDILERNSRAISRPSPSFTFALIPFKMYESQGPVCAQLWIVVGMKRSMSLLGWLLIGSSGSGDVGGIGFMNLAACLSSKTIISKLFCLPYQNISSFTMFRVSRIQALIDMNIKVRTSLDEFIDLQMTELPFRKYASTNSSVMPFDM